jgi:transcriptional regulator with XRE-family HTH domain
MGDTIPVVLGRNVRRLRTSGGLTLAAVAEEVRSYGVRWSTGRITRIEQGDGSVTVETLIVLSLGLSELLGTAVTPAQLLSSDDPVQLGEGVAVRSDALGEVLAGRKTSLLLDDVEGAVEALAQTTRQVSETRATVHAGLAEERAARKLGWSDEELSQLALSLWGRSLSVEARARAGEGATPQKVGHVTRELMAELKAAGHGDD